MDSAIASPIAASEPIPPKNQRPQRPARVSIEQFDETYFRTLFQATSERVIILKLDGTIHYVSPRVCRMMGYTSAQTIGRNSLDFVHPDDQQAIQDFVWNRFSHLKDSEAVLEIRLRQANGQWLYVETLPGMFKVDGRVIGVSMMFHDVTQRKKAELALQHRIAVEQLVASISTWLARATAEQLDQVLEYTLSSIGPFIGAEFCSFWEYSANRQIVYLRSIWSGASLEAPLPKDLQFPRDEAWAEALNANGYFQADKVDDLPQNAQIIRGIAQTAGLKSLLSVAISDGDNIIGELSANTISQEIHWTEEHLHLMRAVSETIASTLIRRQAEAAMQRRINIEQLVAMISRHLGGALPEEINQGIYWTLQRTCETLDVESGYVFQYSADGKLSSATHCHGERTSEAQRNHLQGIPVNPLWAERIASQRQIYFLDINMMPPEMEDIQASMRVDGVRSVLAVPLMLESKHTGDLVLQSTRTRYMWTDEDIRLIQLIGETVSTALARMDSRQAMQQRLEYEHLLGEISAGFVKHPIDQISQAIQGALDKLGTFLGGELCLLWEYSDDLMTSSSTHTWQNETMTGAAVNLSVPVNAWWTQQLLTDHFIYCPDVNTLPDEAKDVREGLLRLGSRSIICVPLMQGEKLIGDLSLSGVTRVPEWTSENVRMMQVIAEIVSGALTRQRAHKALQQRIDFEHLAAEISAAFAHITAEQTDSAITNILAKLGHFVGSDICRVFLVDEQVDLLSIAYEWRAPGLKEQFQSMQRAVVSWSQLPWRERLENNEVITMDDVIASSTLAATRLKRDYQRRGLQSMLSVPIMIEGRLIGVLGLDSLNVATHWTDENITLVRLIAGLIGSALARKRAANAIKAERDLLEIRVDERTRQLSKLLDVSSTVNSMLDLKSLLNVILEKLREVVDFDSAAITRLEKINEVSGDLRVISHVGNFNPARLVNPGTYSATEDVHLREMMLKLSPIIISDTTANTPLAAAYRRRQIRIIGRVPERILCVMYVPLIVQQRVIGTMVVNSTRRHAYNQHTANLTFAFANQVAASIYKAQNHQQAVEAAALTERSRLARELHDSVSQALFGIVLAARTLQQNTFGKAEVQPVTNTPNTPNAANPLEYLLALSEAALSEMRALIFELRPESLRTEGLLTAFRRQADALAQRHHINVEVQVLTNEPTLAIEVKEALYRVGLEAIQNTIKHAHATRLGLRVSQQDEQFQIEISDDGCGFDVGTRAVGHFGLQTMQERATAVGGKLDIDSVIGLGTTVRVSVPAPAQALPASPEAMRLPA